MNRFEKIKKEILNLKKSMRNQIEESDDKGQALLETSSEVLGGIEKAFDHYIKKEEKAWQ